MDFQTTYRWLLLISAHVALDIVLLFAPWNFPDSAMWVAIAVPISQNNLVGIWACTGQLPPVVRLSLWPFGLAATWAVAIGLMQQSFTSIWAGAWGTAFLSQSLVIGVVLGLISLIRPAIRDRRRSAAPRQFTLRELLLVIVAISIALGLFRTVAVRSQWSHEVFDWEFFALLLAIGLSSGLYGLVMYLGSTVNRLRAVTTMVTPLGVVALGAVSFYLFEVFFADLGGYTLVHAMTFAGAQGVSLAISLIFLQYERVG